MDQPNTMTLVDVCSNCETLFAEGEEHCLKCGSDRRTSAVQRELRDLCPTYIGDEAETDDLQREIKPIFEPTWGKEQWYETKEGRKKRSKGP